MGSIRGPALPFLRDGVRATRQPQSDGPSTPQPRGVTCEAPEALVQIDSFTLVSVMRTIREHITIRSRGISSSVSAGAVRVSCRSSGEHQDQAPEDTAERQGNPPP